MSRDTGIIKHIIEHIENVHNTQKRFGNDYAVFVSDKDYFNSVCMSLLQIGELAHHLTAEFTASHTDIPWRNIIGIRNVVVHGYNQLDTETVWLTLTNDLPELHRKCKEITAVS
jgi:uncharacterized protein with HEPN domain